MSNYHIKFETIYKNHSNNIFLFCLSRVSNRDQALDITQEAFLRLWREITAGQNIKSEQAFLFKITRNLIIDWYRKRKNTNINQVILDKIEGGEFISADPVDKFEVEAEYRYILSKIEQLKPAYKYPLYLRLIKDFPVKKIAEILGISVNAASVKISRGLSELRKKMRRTKN
jgi:RNA polymerase sigma-70 factor (ECF subfamily)